MEMIMFLLMKLKMNCAKIKHQDDLMKYNVSNFYTDTCDHGDIELTIGGSLIATGQAQSCQSPNRLYRIEFCDSISASLPLYMCFSMNARVRAGAEGAFGGNNINLWVDYTTESANDGQDVFIKIKQKDGLFSCLQFQPIYGTAGLTHAGGVSENQIDEFIAAQMLLRLVQKVFTSAR
jgi:hypothetical protein